MDMGMIVQDKREVCQMSVTPTNQSSRWEGVYRSPISCPAACSRGELQNGGGWEGVWVCCF